MIEINTTFKFEDIGQSKKKIPFWNNIFNYRKSKWGN
jgi:hypothetical protein